MRLRRKCMLCRTANETEGASKWWPLLVPIFCTVEVILFIITMYVNNCPHHTDGCVLGFLGRFSFQPFRSNPLLGPAASTLLKMGGLSSDQHWRPFTCIWLHAGLFHLFVNVFCLLLVGLELEQEFGFGKVGCIFFLSGFGGSLFGTIFLHHQVSAGASIPLFGLLGARVSELITNRSFYSTRLAPSIATCLILVVNLAIGIFPHVGNFAHIGGFIFGCLLGFIFLMQSQSDFDTISHGRKPMILIKYQKYQLILCLAAAILLITGYIILMSLVFMGVNGSADCAWCKYLACVPSRWWNCNDDGTDDGQATCNYVISGSYMFMRCMHNERGQLFSGFFTSSGMKLLCADLCRGIYGG